MLTERGVQRAAQDARGAAAARRLHPRDDRRAQGAGDDRLALPAASSSSASRSSAIVDRLAHIAGAGGHQRAARGARADRARRATGQPARRDQPAGADLRLVRQGRLARGGARGPGAARRRARGAAGVCRRCAGDLPAGLATIGAVRDDGLDLRQFQKEVVHAAARAAARADRRSSGRRLDAGAGRRDAREPSRRPARAKLVQALRAFGQADLRADPLSPLPLELALADAVAEPLRRTGARAAPPPARGSRTADPRGRSGRRQRRPAPRPHRAPRPRRSAARHAAADSARCRRTCARI